MEDYSQPNNDAVDFSLEDYSQPNNDAVNFTPSDEVDDEPGFDIGTDPIKLPFSLDLPTQPLNLTTMNVGFSVFLLGLLGVLGGGAAWSRNIAAWIMLTFAIFALLASGLFGIGLELFWAMIAATVFLLMAGMVARWIT